MGVKTCRAVVALGFAQQFKQLVIIFSAFNIGAILIELNHEEILLQLQNITVVDGVSALVITGINVGK